MFLFLLFIIGLFVGVFGAVIGAAGGFMLVPILLFLYPGETPSVITSITLTVAFFSALSGAVAYGLLKRIDYRSGLIFAAAAVPASVVGAAVTFFIDRLIFQYIFGVVLLIIGLYLLIKPARNYLAVSVSKFLVTREITDCKNNVYCYSFSQPLGITIALVIGFFGGLLGIGGGIMHVPALIQLMNFPAYIATATSNFVVSITTLSAVCTHIAAGEFTQGITKALVLAAGAVIGAQAGARISHKISGVLIVRLLAAALIVVSVRLLIHPV